MRKMILMLNLSAVRKTIENANTMARLMLIGAISTLAVILLASVGSIVQSNAQASPVSSIKGLAAAVSDRFFTDMLGMEVPGFQSGRVDFTFSGRNVLAFMVRFLTDVNVTDPKTMLAHEIPGVVQGTTTVLRPGKVDNPGDPIDLAPPSSVFAGDAKAGETQNGAKPIPAPAGSDASKVPGAGNKVAFVYQSHSSESFLPELREKNITDPNKAFDANTNIMQVGKRLADGLEKSGIGTVQSTTYYPSIIKSFDYYKSYKYSKKTVEEAMAVNSGLTYFFDIHRDSLPRKKTTVTIGGKDYAQVHFIIGMGNPNWKQNEAFAGQIHELLESRMPGLSKGIYAKTTKEGDGVYNQNVSPNSILIEVGGPYNTLEECYRTADALAQTISEVINKSTKANGKL